MIKRWSKRKVELNQALQVDNTIPKHQLTTAFIKKKDTWLEPLSL